MRVRFFSDRRRCVGRSAAVCRTGRETYPVRRWRIRCNPLPAAHFVLIHCFGDYTTNLSIECLLDDDVILAYRHENKPLHKDHGGPLRLVVPKRYGWKSAKWIKEIELINENKPGFWESRGYHMDADPWREQRFS